ncbi:MAG: COG4280 domain-containing protein [Candidatus Saccharimonadales bacterium]
MDGNSALLAGTSLGIILSTFAGGSVEMVEMSTIVLGVGATRGWKSTLIGAASGLVILLLIVAGLGAEIKHIPIHWLRLVVGALLLTFGLSWLRKAVLKNAGIKKSKSKQKAPSKKQAKFGVEDWYAFTLAFKGTLLEGLEIVFIVLTFGASSGYLLPALIGGGAAVIIIAAASVLVRNKIAQIPEKILKFIVGILLTSFGTFWAAEGAYVYWPGNDIFIIVLIIFFLGLALGYVKLAKKGAAVNV